MKIYINSAGEITCSPPAPKSTVADLANAVERFCLSHIDCTVCTNTCCAGFIVFADNVFVKKFAVMARQAMGDVDAKDAVLRAICLDPATRKWFVPQKADGRCRFLSDHGRCLIYNIRPLVCQLHVCRPSESNYRQIKDELYFAYQEALKAEMLNRMYVAETHTPEYWVRDNPVFGMDNYDTKILDVIAWSHASLRRMLT